MQSAPPHEAERTLLVQQGLSSSNGSWLNPAELELRRRFDALDALIRRQTATRQSAEAALRQNEQIRAELERREALEKQAGGDKAAAAPSTRSAGSPDGKKSTVPERLTSQVPDVTGLGEQTPLQLALIDWTNARTALLLACLDLQRRADGLERSYQALAADKHIEQALAALGGGRLGPAKDYRRDPRLAAASKQVLTAQLPLYRESGRWRVTAVIDEQTPATFSFVEQSQPTLVSATLAQTLGLEPDRNAKRETVRLGERTVPVQRARLASLRLGKFVFRDVPTLVLPPEAEDFGSQLASGALAGCRVSLQPHRMVLELESLAWQRPAGGRLPQWGWHSGPQLPVYAAFARVAGDRDYESLENSGD